MYSCITALTLPSCQRANRAIRRTMNIALLTEGEPRIRRTINIPLLTDGAILFAHFKSTSKLDPDNNA